MKAAHKEKFGIVMRRFLSQPSLSANEDLVICVSHHYRAMIKLWGIATWLLESRYLLFKLVAHPSRLSTLPENIGKHQPMMAMARGAAISEKGEIPCWASGGDRENDGK